MGAIATGRVDTTQRVQALRELMTKYGIDAYVIPSGDEHASEYPAESDLRRGFITGFTGSAGSAIVTTSKALLFTDGRYFLQAGQQLEPSVWTLMKQGEPNVPTWQEFLSKKLPKGTKIGMDTSLISADDAKDITAELNKSGSSLIAIKDNLVDQVWSDRPNRPSKEIFVLDDAIAGRSSSNKIKELRDDLKKKNAQGFVANMLDETAWLFNLRGSDVPYNPVFFSFALVTLDEVLLYINDSQLTDKVKKALGSEVTLRPYSEFYNDLHQVGARLKEGEKILIGKTASLAVQDALGGEGKVEIVRSIVGDQKSIKNEVELDGFRQSHIRDGVALCQYFAWLEEQLKAGNKVTESEGADKLSSYRQSLDHFRGESFTTISSTGPNGAIIHYSPDPQNCPAIDINEIYLCDSGAQFTDGTTDVTRTWHFGSPAKEHIRAFTRVLQGHIAIDRAVFPKGTTGYLLDVLARRALWEDGLDYRHGTGHGVGHFLNVHEGPQGIGTRAVFNETSLKENMVVSNEPGYYEDGKWGIRIENLVIVRPAKTPNNFGAKGYLTFEHLTMCPIQVSLVDAELLTNEDKQWLNDYHDEVLNKVGPLLQKDQRAFEWLKRQCSARV
ncbi:probable aminopeptidase P, cytoplasmic [Melanopsichium pennsylvanicum]|uniref:Probable aminopeptidase P, cytoplasmic n=2 Tax=Melanopsichium pennsylvanicum TaxID=63383 RepID=A0AAJ5C663_9BASI|nr:probable aminopeptidase P, cytoplasmic [Melanopsichium pennsylvanicum 4]SNX85258.1 probable aminopeptidase P, cytoplasmic [Melanopsichium pennsylvanicum]